MMNELKNGDGQTNGNGVASHNRISVGGRDLYVRQPTDDPPPHNLEAERKVLGAMLLDNDVIDDVRAVVAAGDFFRDSHQTVFRAICELYDHDKPVDGLTLAEELIRRGEYGECGGDAMLAALAGSTPHSANVLYHAEIVREKSAMRSLIESAVEVIRDGYSNRYTASDLVNRVQERRSNLDLADYPDEGDVFTGLRPWPAPIAPEGWHGVAGRIVAKIAPHTEADPAAIYLQLLAAIANLVGRTPHWRVEATRHALSLFVCVVGASSRARKGTSWDHVRHLLRQVEEDWVRDRVQGGLSSGEGLIWSVRDPITKTERIGGAAALGGGGTREVEVDPGVTDKRALFVESEFGGTLSMLAREGNSLSSYLRQAWESGTFRSATKHSPARTTDAHVGVIAHITGEELRRKLTANDTANGFANRFLWVCARRSRYLPLGGAIHTEDFSAELHELRGVVDFADRECDPDVPIRLDREAQVDWIKAYSRFSDRGGLLGSLVDRGEAQTMRLAALFALLDFSHYIRRDHLAAALAVWRYCEDSAAYIFADHVGDPNADKLVDAVRAAGEAGLTLNQIRRKVFSGHKSSMEIAGLLKTLYHAGLVEQCDAPSASASGRRALFIWRVKQIGGKESAPFAPFAPQFKNPPQPESRPEVVD